jgi:hypothetical protein
VSARCSQQLEPANGVCWGLLSATDACRCAVGFMEPVRSRRGRRKTLKFRQWGVPLYSVFRDPQVDGHAHQSRSVARNGEQLSRT